MKKIINNKKYDTDTATEICEDVQGEYVTDFNYRCWTLYKKRAGEFFVHELTCLGGEKIIPVSNNDAKRFAEINMDGEQYGQLFGKVSE